MKIPPVVALACLTFNPVGLAQAPAGQPKAAPQKSPVDLAAADFYTLRNDKAAKVDEARFKQLIAAGIAFIQQNPTHGQVNGVVNGLANFSDTMTDKNLAAFRGHYRGVLKFALIDERNKEGLTPEARAAMAALEAASLDADMRASPDKETLDALRESIDRLTAMPGGGRFLVDRERSYVEIQTKAINAAAGERHLRKLTQHADKGVAGWARADLNLLEIKKAPYELKFTALDGKECDVAKLRGKAVALVFFATTNEGSVKSLLALKKVQADYKRELAVIAVSFDQEADREKVDALVKANKLAWPVHFDGQGAKNEWASMLNISRVPAIVFFDQKGILLTNNQRAERVEAEVKRLFKIK
ncbi:MAG: TlpA family protein disulfide reductase [Opitutus sp.]|nr:TlpA family protein disulfide reductase [Opitutus sp.]